MAWYFNAATGETKQLDDALYAAWLDKGNPKALSYALIPDPPAPGAWYDGSAWQVYEPTIEQLREQMTCSPAQGRLALLNAGLLDAVEAWVATQSRAVQIEYASRTEWRRTWPLVISAGTTLGLTDTDLDALFAAAGAL